MRMLLITFALLAVVSYSSPAVYAQSDESEELADRIAEAWLSIDGVVSVDMVGTGGVGVYGELTVQPGKLTEDLALTLKMWSDMITDNAIVFDTVIIADGNYVFSFTWDDDNKRMRYFELESYRNLGTQLVVEDCTDAANLLPAIVEIASTSAAQPMSAINTIYGAVVQARAACTGLSFSSDEHGARPLIGPFHIPEGTYRATFTTAGYGSVSLTPLSGECGQGQFFSELLFNGFEGDFEDGAQVAVMSAGCEALLGFDNISDPPWTLVFEKIR